MGTVFFFNYIGPPSSVKGLLATDLVTLIGTQNKQVVETVGYYVDGDGGGGQFFWDVGNANIANNGTIFGSSVTGRWIRLYVGEINVKWFGAKGDSLTDDYLSINAALEYVKTLKGTLYFPKGVYLINTTLSLDDTRGITLRGDVGRVSGAELRYTSNTGALVSLHSALYATIKSLFLTYSDPAYMSDLVSMDWSAAAADPAYNTFSDCTFAGILPAKSATSLVRLNRAIICTIERCIFSTAQRGIVGLDPSYSNAITITETTFMQIDGDAIYDPGEAWVIQNCTFEPDSNGAPSGVGTSGTSFSYGVLVSGCWFGDASIATRPWIKLYCLGATVVANRFQAPPGGTCIELMAGSQGIGVLNNRLEGTIGVQLPTGPAYAYAINIIGNDFHGTILSGTFYVGLTCLSNLGIVNTISNGTTFQGESTPQEYGIYSGYLTALPTAKFSGGVAMLDSTTGFPLYSVGVFAPSAGAAAETIFFRNTGANTLAAALRVGPNGLAFNGTAPTAKPTIVGAKDGNAALTSLLTALANMGLISDSTT